MYTSSSEIYTLSLHDALPIWAFAMAVTDRMDRRQVEHVESHFGDVGQALLAVLERAVPARLRARRARSEEHTSELQSQSNLVCRLLLEKKKTKKTHSHSCNLN